MKQVKEQIVKLLKVDFLVGENALKNWIMILFALFLCIIMIYSSHTISKLTDEVRDLRSEFVDVRSQLQRVRLESSVLKSLKDSGLKQSETPPNKIKVIVKQ